MIPFKMLKAPVYNLKNASVDDPRVGHLIEEPVTGKPAAVIVGFPSDEGVRINGGRPGAAEAPDKIREALYKLTPDATNLELFSALLRQTKDLGNVEVTGALDQDQEMLGEVLGPWLEQEVVTITIGGGHETAFGHFLGYVKANQPTQIMNVDAHADVRPLKNGSGHSGSPFWQALEHESKLCTNYTVLGLLPWSVSATHLAWMEDRKCMWRYNDELSASTLKAFWESLQQPAMVTFDLDLVDQSEAPGVSAPAVGGMELSLFCYAAYLAGQSPWVKSFDLVEYNPTYDIDNQTARAAALALWNFLKGLANRDT